VALVGDTSRYQSFGPFQGKRFNLGVRYYSQLSGDSVGDLLEYRADYRGYRQVTRRSTLAWRVAATVNGGDTEILYGLGGLNQLRGYDFREFTGSSYAYSNLEFRFPLAEQIAFPILAIQQIRGFFFFDVGAAKLNDDLFYDRNLGGIRVDATGQPVKFQFWDSEEGRLQDGRASYGMGFHFRFLGGLQFNWAFTRQMDYTQFVFDPASPTGLTAVNGARDGMRSEFYIMWDY
jgi:outer membrane protein insertion porin family